MKVRGFRSTRRRPKCKPPELALSGVQKEAQVGQRTTLDVLNAQQDLTAARSRLIVAQRDRVVASYTLLSAIGRLDHVRLTLSTRPITIRRPIISRCATPGMGCARRTGADRFLLSLAVGRRAIDEQAALGDDALAGLQTFDHLDHAAADEPGLDLTQFDRLVVTDDPGADQVSFIDQRFARHRDAAAFIVAEDGDVREHLGLQQRIWILERWRA